MVADLFDFNEFFELKFYFLGHFRCGVNEHGHTALSEIFRVLMCFQGPNTYPATVQDIDDSIQHRKIIVCGEKHHKVLLDHHYTIFNV